MKPELFRIPQILHCSRPAVVVEGRRSTVVVTLQAARKPHWCLLLCRELQASSVMLVAIKLKVCDGCDRIFWVGYRSRFDATRAQTCQTSAGPGARRCNGSAVLFVPIPRETTLVTPDRQRICLIVADH